MTDTAWKKFLKRLRLVPAVEVEQHKHMYRLGPSRDSAYLVWGCTGCESLAKISKRAWRGNIRVGKVIYMINNSKRYPRSSFMNASTAQEINNRRRAILKDINRELGTWHEEKYGR